jgi:hypothetical protein
MSSSGGAFSATSNSPGPVYYPNLAFIGEGPLGTGPLYSMRASHRVSQADCRTTQSERPGPKYMLPTGLGKQWESTKRSLGAGKISQAPRKTVDTGPERSPGPAAYNRESLGLKTVLRNRPGAAELKTGMGGAQRFFNSETRTSVVPGPGAYALPNAVGGYMVRVEEEDRMPALLSEPHSSEAPRSTPVPCRMRPMAGPACPPPLTITHVPTPLVPRPPSFSLAAAQEVVPHLRLLSRRTRVRVRGGLLARPHIQNTVVRWHAG